MSDFVFAARELEGKKLASGWSVLKKIDFPMNSTERTTDDLSVYYEVEKNDCHCFMKAIDFSQYMSVRTEGQKTTDLIKNMIDDFNYERDLSIHCQKRKVTKVAFVIESGEEEVEGYLFGIVPYLIFEKADGDVRAMLAYSEKLDLAWMMKSLHDVAVGVQQLHHAGVSHQNLKPSNVLLFKGDSKIGDLGKALCPELNVNHYDVEFQGDYSYEPPELLYGYPMHDWEKRSYLADCYVLGGLIVFYLLGVTMNGVLFRHLPDQFHPATYAIPFNAVKGYLMEAYEKALEDINKSLYQNPLRERIVTMVKYLCYPDPERRGHPKTIKSKDSNYNLERFISELDYLNRKAELELLK